MLSNLPPKEYKFSIKVNGEETGMEFSGDFVYRRLTIGDKISLQKWLSSMIDEKSDSESVRSSYLTLAIIRFGCIECPSWFKESDYGINLYDFNVVNEIFVKKIEKEAEWSEKIKEKAENIEIKQNQNG